MLVVVFVASLIRSTFGFGEALVAVPLLALMMPVRQAAPLAVLLSITIALVVVLQDWRKVHFRSAAGLLLASALGTPFGLLLLRFVAPAAIRLALGVFLLLYCLWSLLGRVTWHPDRDPGFVLALCGFFAGVLGGVCGMNGPPLVIYGSLRHWSAPQFRATLQAYFLPASLMVAVGYRATGLWTANVTHNYLLCLPVLAPALVLGRYFNRRIDGARFQRMLYIGLIAVALLLLCPSL